MENYLTKRNVLSDAVKSLNINDGDVILVKYSEGGEAYYQLQANKFKRLNDGPEHEEEYMPDDIIAELITGQCEFKKIANGNYTDLHKISTRTDRIECAIYNIQCTIDEFKKAELKRKEDERKEGIISIAITGGLLLLMLILLLIRGI